MLYADLIKFVEEVANPAFAAMWDKSGLQVAAQRREVHKLAVFLDPLPKVLGRALEMGADCMLSHHPLSLKPELPDKLDNYHASLKILLCADIPLYAAHTSLDANPDGPAFWLGKDLDLIDTALLDPGNCGSGFGEVGSLPRPVDVKDFLRRLLALLNIDNAIMAGPPLDGKIQRLAYCGGSGASFINMAKKSGAQLYITGDVKYHAAQDAEIPVLDVGHHSLEEEMMRRFAIMLDSAMPDMEVIFIASRSPFRILSRRESDR